jgi:hypothetical protein
MYHLIRGRHGAISAKKIKNNMLAAVLVLTIVPVWVKVGRAVVEHGCFLISQKLLDADDVSFFFLFFNGFVSYMLFKFLSPSRYL